MDDPEYIREASRRGVFASIVSAERHEVQSAIEIVRSRFEDIHNLRGAFGRRALIEQAKGILIERHDADAKDAFELLRKQSRRTGRRLVDVARDVTDYRALLPERTNQRD